MSTATGGLATLLGGPLIAALGIGLSIGAERGPGLIAGIVLCVAGVVILLACLRQLRQRTQALEQALTLATQGEPPPLPDPRANRIVRNVADLSRRLHDELDERSGELEQVKRALAAAGDQVIAIDSDARIAYLNPAAAADISRSAPYGGRGRDSADDWLGAPLIDAVADPDLYTAVEACLREGAPAALTVERESRRYRAVVAPLVSEDGASPAAGPWSVVVALHDLSDLHEAEQSRRDFFINASHELRTPLATIAAAAETLEVVNDPKDAQRFRVIIQSEAERMSELIEEMLALARLESGLSPPDIRTLELGPLVEQAVERLRPQAERKSVDLSLRTPEAVVAADPDLTQRALINLVHNAIKFTPAGGQVEVFAESGPLFDPAPMIWLRVRDTGIGVPAAEQPRIFQRFYRVDRARTGERSDGASAAPGTGLGLAVVRHIAEIHGGGVALESAPGDGSTFSFSLPLAQQRPAAPPNLGADA